jgi:hypothetical protein
MLNINIQDPKDTSKKAGVDSDGFLQVIGASWPLAGFSPRIYPYRQQMTLNGVVGASSDMRVNGSVTNQIFALPRPATTLNEDLYITTLSIVIADTLPALNQFGNKTAMVTGCLLQYITALRSTVLNPSLKSNWDFVRMALGSPAFGATTNAFYASNVSGTSEAYIPIMDLTKYSPPWGIRLSRNTTEALQFIVKDDLSATSTRYVTQFDIVALGFTRI